MKDKIKETYKKAEYWQHFDSGDTVTRSLSAKTPPFDGRS